jgi:flagellar protein FliS
MVAYKQSQYQAYSLATRTVAKTRQVVMLYDGAIRFLKQAKEAIREKRIEDRYNLLVKASEIVVGLQSSIDFEQGGELASTLHGFYTGITRRILAVNTHKDAQGECDAIIGELKSMRDVWDGIDQTLGKPEGHSSDKPTPPEGGGTPDKGGFTVSA